MGRGQTSDLLASVRTRQQKESILPEAERQQLLEVVKLYQAHELYDQKVINDLINVLESNNSSRVYYAKYWLETQHNLILSIARSSIQGLSDREIEKSDWKKQGKCLQNDLDDIEASPIHKKILSSWQEKLAASNLNYSHLTTSQQHRLANLLDKQEQLNNLPASSEAYQRLKILVN
jgi:hypothetical protein